MYHRGNDRSDSNRREDFEDGDYRKSSSKKSRSRWDDPDSRREGDEEGKKGASGKSRWDARRSEGEEEAKSRSSNRWEEGPYSSAIHSKRNDRSRSRSRSKSPFRRKDDEYSRYSNPSRRHENKDSSNHSGGTGTGGNISYSKPSSWSDSSDEDSKDKSLPSSSGRSMKASQGHGPGSSSNESGNKPNFSSSGPGPGLCLKLNGPGSSAKSTMPLPKTLLVSAPVKSAKIASIFNDDDDDEPEEMPAECKMRMKNVGRETKTSEGPNSFGKTKIGFCNLSHLTEKRLEGKGVAKKKP